MRILSAYASNYDPCTADLDAVIAAASEPQDERAPAYSVCDAAMAYTCRECGHEGVDVLDGYPEMLHCLSHCVQKPRQHLGA
jgi:hypothetical protein